MSVLIGKSQAYPPDQCPQSGNDPTEHVVINAVDSGHEVRAKTGMTGIALALHTKNQQYSCDVL